MEPFRRLAKESFAGTESALDLNGLSVLFKLQRDSGADGIAVGFGANEFDEKRARRAAWKLVFEDTNPGSSAVCGDEIKVSVVIPIERE